MGVRRQKWGSTYKIFRGSIASTSLTVQLTCSSKTSRVDNHLKQMELL